MILEESRWKRRMNLCKIELLDKFFRLRYNLPRALFASSRQAQQFSLPWYWGASSAVYRLEEGHSGPGAA